MKMRLINRANRSAGFSLVEVTLALGIVTFALVVLLGTLATALDTEGAVTERRGGIQAIDALLQYLNDDDAFDPADRFEEIYSWAQASSGDEQVLAYVTYRYDPDAPDPDAPVASGESVRSIWLDDFSNYSNYEDAREGEWVLVRLSLADGPTDDGPNPVDPGSLPATADLYEHAYLVFRAEVFEVAVPQASVVQNALTEPVMFTTTVVARR